MASELEDLLKQSLESTDDLNQNFQVMGIRFLNNYNYLKDNIFTLNDNLGKINTKFDTLNKFLNGEYLNFISQKVDTLNRMYMGLYGLNEMNADGENVGGKLFADIYNKNFELLYKAVRLDLNSNLDTIYNISFPEEIVFEENSYYINIYYKNANDIFQFDIKSELLHSIKSSDNTLERYRLDNTKYNISKSLRNYKLYILDADGKELGSGLILRSDIVEDKLDIICFSASKESLASSFTTIEVREELFDPFMVELNFGNYTIEDIGNVLLGNVDRDLDSGVFTAYDKRGKVIVKNVSVRYGRMEKRTVLQ